MKKNTPLWGSISILIGVVIVILALTRGTLCTVLLTAVFVAWGLWIILTQVLPNRRAARAIQQIQPNAYPDQALMQTLLRHVNYRISGCLKSAYPDAQWEWVMRDPAGFVAQGGTGRIRVSGIPEYDYADVTLDRNGKLSCSLVKVAPIGGSSGEKPGAPAQDTLDPRIWYETQGREVLERLDEKEEVTERQLRALGLALAGDLESRGHHSLTLKEDGTICTQSTDGGTETSQGAFTSFPERVYWPGLVKVLEQNGLAATTQDNGIIVAW